MPGCPIAKAALRSMMTNYGHLISLFDSEEVDFYDALQERANTDVHTDAGTQRLRAFRCLVQMRTMLADNLMGLREVEDIKFMTLQPESLTDEVLTVLMRDLEKVLRSFVVDVAELDFIKEGPGTAPMSSWPAVSSRGFRGLETDAIKRSTAMIETMHKAANLLRSQLVRDDVTLSAMGGLLVDCSAGQHDLLGIMRKVETILNVTKETV